jgi:2-polyprenyl-3-methyl-5-hydroxy-6-metoxy-1,4-benzoquinol methylase
VETVHCPICEVADDEIWGRHYAGYTIVKCRRCGLRYLNPRPNAAETLAMYGDLYFDQDLRRQEDPEVASHVAENNRRYAITCLRHCRAPNPCVLDIGTGLGKFLIYLSRMPGIGRLGGTDITEVNRERLAAHGIDLYLGDIAELELGSWDVVTVHHVLEHVLDPNTFLTRVANLLEDDGILHLVLPNEGSFMSRWKSFLSRAGFKPRPFKHLGSEHHLWYFERETLTRLLEKNGYHVVYAGTRAAVKQRNPARRVAHRALDALGLNTWLEFVAEPFRQPDFPDRLERRARSGV